MKKQFFLLLTICIQTTFIFSQTNNKGNLSLSAGPSFPIGHFANTNLYDETSGFAKTGESISLSYDRPVTKKISLLINLSGQRNPINKNAFESSFSKAKIYQGFSFGTGVNNPPVQTSYAIYPNWKFDKSAWLCAALQLGGKATLPLSEQRNIHFIISATAGALYATSPELKGNSITDTATAIIIQNKSSGFGLIYSLGCGLQYQINKTFFVIATIDYTGTNKVTFKDNKTLLTTTKGIYGTPGYSVQQSTTTVDGKQKIGSINLLVGVGISF